MRRDLLWRAMWTVGLSLAVVVFVGLLLNLMPFGLTRLSWNISLTAVAIAAALPVGIRRARPAIGRLPSRAAMGYLAGSIAIGGAAVGLAVASAGWQHSAGFAQLWLVPEHSATGGHATIGVRNQYRGHESFHLVLLRGTQPAAAWDFTLGAGQSWLRDVSAPAGQRLTAQLSTVNQPSGTQSVAVTSS